MAYKIQENVCVACGACSSVCPVGAISEGSPAFVIDESACVDCGACQSNCPVGAIVAP